MFAAILAFFTNAAPVLSIASELLPMLAMARSLNDPAVSNAGLANTIKAIQFVQPIVNQVEAVSTSGATPMSGPDKLALFGAIVQEAHDVAVGAGASGKLVEAMPLLNAAVTAVCATMKQRVANPGITLQAQPQATVGSLAAITANTGNLQNSA